LGSQKSYWERNSAFWSRDSWGGKHLKNTVRLKIIDRLLEGKWDKCRDALG